MKIRITGHAGEAVFPFGLEGPWKQFEKVIEERGHLICRKDFSESADAIIANSFDSNVRNFISNSRIPKSRRILVLWEPYIVEKTRYQPRVLDLFGTVFAPSIDWAERVSGQAFPWPQDNFSDETIFNDWSSRINRVVVIQGNKFSATKGELYSARRRVLKSLNENELSLFGTNWNKGMKFDWWHWSRSLKNTSLREFSLKSSYGIGRKYCQYGGGVSDKTETLRKFQISLVIENSPDFISEKLFDSVRSGCVTIYLGPSLEKYGLSSESAIEVSNNPKKIAELVQSLIKISNSERRVLAVKQFRALQPSLQDWNNYEVLSSMAQKMLAIIEN